MSSTTKGSTGYKKDSINMSYKHGKLSNHSDMDFITPEEKLDKSYS